MPDARSSSRATLFVERLLRVPREPEAPAGGHESVRVFRAAPAFYRYRLLLWGVKRVLTAIGITLGLLFFAALPHFPFKWVAEIVEALATAGFVVSLPFSYLMVHLDYQMRWYIVTDRSLRIREGLMSVQEKTMSFANVQNVSIRQNPIQRFFGIADVEVRTAGGGSGATRGEHKGPDLHLGYFRGVDNAEEIRDAVLARVRLLRDSGLGDPDAPPAAPALTAGEREMAAGRELLEEARRIRAALVS